MLCGLFEKRKIVTLQSREKNLESATINSDLLERDASSNENNILFGIHAIKNNIAATR